MESIKVVVRYADGRVLKGFTQDFFPNKDRFHLHPVEGTPGKGIEIRIRDLKAVFFVRDFDGNPKYNERKSHLADEKFQGRIVEVTFADGEILVGSTLGYDPKRQGFFLFPRDSESNNVGSSP
jgi:hypothetical protein